MAAGDAKPVPIKGQAFRATFPMFDADGDVVPNLTLLSQISVDGASASYGARPTEISANMGMYTLDLTAAQMNGATIAVVATVAGGSSTVKSTPMVFYTQEFTDLFRAEVVALTATSLDRISANVWASGTKNVSLTGSSFSNSATDTIAAAVWSTGTRTLTSLGAGVITGNTFANSATDAIAVAVWGTGSGLSGTRALSQSAYNQIVNQIWATPTRTVTDVVNALTKDDIAANVWASGTRGVTSVAAGAITGSSFANSATDTMAAGVWATGTRSITGGTVTTVSDKTGYSIASGGIVAASFGAGAIDSGAIAADAIGSSELAQSAAQEIADEILNRDIAGSASGGARIVRDALRILRNRVIFEDGTMTVYQENDSTAAWSAAYATSPTVSAFTDIDPA